MTIQEIIEKTEQEIAQIQEKLNSRQPVACTHSLCPDCATKAIQEDKEAELIFTQLNEKIQLINDLKSIK